MLGLGFSILPGASPFSARSLEQLPGDSTSIAVETGKQDGLQSYTQGVGFQMYPWSLRLQTYSWVLGFEFLEL